MNLLTNDIVERFYGFLWPMLRISALLLSAPVFSLRALNLRLRILLALALTWMIYPLYSWPQLDPLSAAGLLEVFNQIAIGLLMGLSLQSSLLRFCWRASRSPTRWAYRLPT